MPDYLKTREKMVQLLTDYFKKKSSVYHIEMVFLYGSWAIGYPRQDSDIDLAILFSFHIKNEDSLFELINSISYELSIEISKEVNIIPLKEDFPHPMLYYNAIILGIPLYINNRENLIKIKLEAIKQMEDFKIFGIPWQREVAKNILKEISHA